MPPRELTGHLDGSGLRIGIVVARFNEYVTRRLLESAVARLDRLGIGDEQITVAWVPGSFELPVVAREMASDGGVDAVICLGAVIRGETAHFDYVARGAAEGIARVSADTATPVIFGVLATYTTDQAMARADESRGNLGAEFAESAVEMANLMRSIKDANG